MNIVLDIGTSKIVALAVASIEGKDQGRAYANKNSSGISKGVIVDIKLTTSAISEVLKELEKQLNTKVNAVKVSVSGHHVMAMRSSGVVGVQGGEITEHDVERVIEAARAVSLPKNQEIIHALPQEYIVDGQSGVERPIGMVGIRLEVNALIMSCSSSALQNTVKCVEKAGARVDQFILSPLASGTSVLCRDEKALGVCLLDIGSGTTDVVVYAKGMIKHLSVIPLAGDHVTNDISVALCTPYDSAEKIKRSYGALTDNETVLHELIDVASVSDVNDIRNIRRQVVTDVVQARYYEIFSYVLSKLQREGILEEIPAGIVLTGGGAKLPGLKYLAESMFEMPARVAWPVEKHLTDDLREESHATLIGLMHECQNNELMLRQPGTGRWQKLVNWLESCL